MSTVIVDKNTPVSLPESDIESQVSADKSGAHGVEDFHPTSRKVLVQQEEQDEEFVKSKDTSSAAAAGLAVANPVPPNKVQTLPQAQEYHRHATKPPLYKQRAVQAIVCMVLAALVGLIVIVLVVVQKKDDPPFVYLSTPPSTQPPTRRPWTPREIEIRAFLAPIIGSEKMQERNSAYAWAANWIANIDDNWQRSSRNNNNTGNLTQRFLLAWFWYHSTNNGQQPWLSCNPPFAQDDKGQSNATYSIVTDSVTWNTTEEEDENNSNDNATCLFYNYSYTLENGTILYELTTATRWLSETHECDWAGVSCNDAGVVHEIVLYANGVGGAFPTELVVGGHLPGLSSLTLTCGSITGTLPTDIGNATNLAVLNLHANNLTGTLPSELFSLPLLEFVNVGVNNFTGVVPSSIGKATNLHYLFLFNNSFRGQIPTQVGLLTKLESTHWYSNQFTGTLPTTLGLLSRLYELWIYSNEKLSGPIPDEIGNLESLADLRLYRNSLTGTLQSMVGKLRELQILKVDGNHLNGTLPDELYNLRNLWVLGLYDNSFTGTISTRVGRLSDLAYFGVSGNLFTGNIPSELGNCLNLQVVWMHYNRFWSNSSVPVQICKLRADDDADGLQYLTADCASDADPHIACECCTSCCNRDTRKCLIQDY